MTSTPASTHQAAMDIMLLPAWASALVVAAAACFWASTRSVGARAAHGRAGPAGGHAAGIPRTADGKPDFSAPTSGPPTCPGTSGAGPTPRCSTASGLRRSSRAASPSTSRARATPSRRTPRLLHARGLPRQHPVGQRHAVLPDEDHLITVHEFQRNTRIIPLDGRPHRRGAGADVRRRPCGQVGGRHAGHQTTNFKRWALDDLPLHEPQSPGRTATRSDRGAAAVEDRESAVLRADDRRPEDLHRAVVAGVRDLEARMGEGRPVRGRVLRKTIAAPAANAKRRRNRLPIGLLPVACGLPSPPFVTSPSLQDVLRPLLGLHHLPAAAARGHGGGARRPRLDGRAADRRRQVALLPGARRRAGPGSRWSCRRSSR